MFDDYKSYPKQRVSPVILWEYDLKSPQWNWEDMKVRVVQRVIQYGKDSDYYAILQMYGGFEGVAPIVKEIACLSDKDLNWACFIFNVRKEETRAYARKMDNANITGNDNWHWIPYAVQKPPLNEKILTLDKRKDGRLEMEIRSLEGDWKGEPEWRNQYGGLDLPSTDVVYWMPIPPMPRMM